MRPRDITMKTRTFDNYYFETKSGLEAGIMADNTTLLEIFIGKFQASLIFPNKIFREIIDWIAAQTPEQYNNPETACLERFGAKAGYRNRQWQVGISSHIWSDRKQISQPATVTIHANGKTPSFWVFRLHDIKQIIKWYNSEIKTRRTK